MAALITILDLIPLTPGKHAIVLDGLTLVQCSRDPARDAAKALLARGYIGRAVIARAGCPPLAKFDIEEMAFAAPQRASPARSLGSEAVR